MSVTKIFFLESMPIAPKLQRMIVTMGLILKGNESHVRFVYDLVSLLSVPSNAPKS